MANDEHVALLKRGVAAWNAWRDENPGIRRPNLVGADLNGANLTGADLRGADLDRADLRGAIARRTAEDSIKDVGALPLLSYTLDDMWTQMVKRGDGMLRLPAQTFELGGVLAARADVFLGSHPKFENELRHIFTWKLANVRDGEEPTRRRALRSEFTDDEWRLVCELVDHPNRLLVTAAEISNDISFYAPDPGQLNGGGAGVRLARRSRRTKSQTR